MNYAWYNAVQAACPVSRGEWHSILMLAGFENSKKNIHNSFRLSHRGFGFAWGCGLARLNILIWL